MVRPVGAADDPYVQAQLGAGVAVDPDKLRAVLSGGADIAARGTQRDLAADVAADIAPSRRAARRGRAERAAPGRGGK